MKKVLCYLGLVLLILIIATPPLLRIFYKEKEELPFKDKIQLLMCTKDTYSISTSYKNGTAINIKFTRLKDDPNLVEYTDQMALEYTLSEILKDNPLVTTSKTSDSGHEMISYLLLYDKVSASGLGEFSNYRLLIDDQKQSYVNEGYLCSIIE